MKKHENYPSIIAITENLILMHALNLKKLI